jgi:hypothetical protein
LLQTFVSGQCNQSVVQAHLLPHRCLERFLERVLQALRQLWTAWWTLTSSAFDYFPPLHCGAEGDSHRSQTLNTPPSPRCGRQRVWAGLSVRVSRRMPVNVAATSVVASLRVTSAPSSTPLAHGPTLDCAGAPRALARPVGWRGHRQRRYVRSTSHNSESQGFSGG